ncbi:MAG: cytochrome P450 [Actinobacteria bacterium]|nr:cytochrome P450 [Actinomycetota bacterium]
MTEFDKPGARDRDSPDMGREAGERAPADAGIDDAEIEAAYVGCCCGDSRRTPSLIPSAVEEVLRCSSPLLYFRRDVVEGMQVADATMEPGDIVALWYVSANRDGSRFDDPDRFDVGRTPNDHVAFGGGGPRSAWGLRRPDSRSGCCWRCWWSATTRSSWPVRSSACGPTSCTASSACRSFFGDRRAAVIVVLGASPRSDQLRRWSCGRKRLARKR